MLCHTLVSVQPVVHHNDSDGEFWRGRMASPITFSVASHQDVRKPQENLQQGEHHEHALS